MNSCAHLEQAFINTRTLNRNNEYTTSSFKYRRNYVSKTDIARTNLIVNNFEWNHVPVKTNHKELLFSVKKDWDLTILDKVIELQMDGIIKKLYDK